MEPKETTEPTMPAPPHDRRDGPNDLAERLDAWVSEGLITRAAADAITAFESGRRSTPSGPGVTPVAEGLAYLGGALAIAAGGTVIGGEWSELSTGVRIAVPAVLWVVTLVVGWRLRTSDAPALVRLSQVLWLLSAPALAWAVELAADEALDVGWAFEASGMVTALAAAALYLARPSTLQQIAVVFGLILTAVAFTQDSATAAGLAVWVLGAVWIALGSRGLLVDRGTSLTIASLLVVSGALTVAIANEDVGAWLAVASSSGLIATGVWQRHLATMSIGTIALFFSTLATISQYVEGSTGIALGLLVAGALVSAVAFGIWRLGRRPRPAGDTGEVRSDRG